MGSLRLKLSHLDLFWSPFAQSHDASILGGILGSVDRSGGWMVWKVTMLGMGGGTSGKERKLELSRHSVEWGLELCGAMCCAVSPIGLSGVLVLLGGFMKHCLGTLS